MSTKNDAIVNLKSSEKLAYFLKKNQLHKKDLAEMIGVTLSYVYNLIDNSIPFSTRSTTLERIATVMDISPEEFVEYKIVQEPIFIDEAILFLKSKQADKKMSTIQLLKAFPRHRRVQIVDILRGADPLPVDWKELSAIANVLSITKDEIYPFWEARLKKILQTAGMNLQTNANLVNAMFKCASDYIHN